MSEEKNSDKEECCGDGNGNPCGTETACDHVAESKQFRKDLDEVLQRLKTATRNDIPDESRGLPPNWVVFSRERNLAITKIQEAIMWLGMDLKAQSDAAKARGEEGQKNPYPESYNPFSPKIEPTADGLKM